MSRPCRATGDHLGRRSGNPARARGIALVWAAWLAVLGVLSQGGLTAVHGLAHAAPGRMGPAANAGRAGHAAACGVAGGYEHEPRANECEQSPRGGHDQRHDQRQGPASDRCDLCAVLLHAAAGWPVPAPIEIGMSSVVAIADPALTERRESAPRRTTAAPRGPPRAS